MARFIANDETKGFGSTGFQELRQLATGSIGPIPMPFVVLIGDAGLGEFLGAAREEKPRSRPAPFP
jgi:hypothetical protein